MIDKTKLWSEVVATFAGAAVAIATLIEPQWFERLFEVAPDEGDGSLETLVTVAICAIACAVFAWRAVRRVRRDRISV
jgi:hypothetical protein